MAIVEVTYEDNSKENIEVEAPNQRDAKMLAKQHAERAVEQGGSGKLVKFVKFIKTS